MKLIRSKNIRHISVMLPLFAAVALPLPSHAQKSQSDPSELLERGREAFMNFNFDEASSLYSQYATRMRRLRKETAPALADYERELENAERMVGRVQVIEIIDSVHVPAIDFFRHVRVPASAGYLLSASEIPFRQGRDEASMAYVPESQSLMMWAQTDSLGVYRIVESTRLVDGGYSEPVYADETLNGGGNVDFPVLSGDGITLHFSSDGEESIGGFDIFETVRDPQTGEYMAPTNVGMPFNSPYDDYLLVTDEENGVGWWATDRNQLDDMVTLYVYMLPETRVNFDGEPEAAVSLARVDDMTETWVEDRTSLAAEIRRVKPGERPKADEFYLPVGAGRVYTRYDQLPDARLRTSVRAYEDARLKFESMSANISEQRRRYDKSHDRALGQQIAEAEKRLETERASLVRLLSDIYRSLR